MASRQFGALRASTHGIVFLGTPHDGASIAKYGELLVRATTILGFWSDARLLNALRKAAPELLKLARNFSDILDDFDVYCFYELIPWKLSSVVSLRVSPARGVREGLNLTSIAIDRF